MEDDEDEGSEDTNEEDERENAEELPAQTKQGDSAVSTQCKSWIAQKTSPKLSQAVPSQNPPMNEFELLLKFNEEEVLDEKEKFEENALLNENELLLEDFPTQVKHGSVCVSVQS